MDKTDSEILTEILIPNSATESKIHFEKVSKRKYLDIASVNMAMSVTGQKGFIEDISLAIGGIAPIPLYMKESCSMLKGQAVSKNLVEKAATLIQQEISPITDVRGSMEYKRLLAHQLVIKSFITLFPESLSAEEFYEKH
jgi:xanthine dehydrogenase small subunit